MKKHSITYRLNRDTTARKALFKSLVQALILRESITTTHAKAMAVRPIFEKLLTKAKSGTLSEIRQIQSVLQNPELLKKLVHVIAPRYKEVKGGYTKITAIGTRTGDNAKMVSFALTKKTVKAAVTPSSVKEAEVKTAPAKAPKTTPVKKLVTPVKETANTVKIAAKRAGRRGDK